jgi:predicted O-linked N-acetylglucosamine transferase (SPINDLY family)
LTLMNISTHSDSEVAIGRLVPLLQQGEFTAAEAFAAQARREFPLDGELARLHGVALLQLQRRAEALIALELAAELAPASVEVQCNLASLAMQENNADAAIERLRATLRHAPGHPAVLQGLGNALMAAARYAQARESFAMATHGAPQNPGLRLNLAAAELQLGHSELAEIYAREVLQMAPSFDAAHSLLGHILRGQGRVQEAADAYQRAERLAPANPQHAFHLGLMLDECGRLDAAVHAYARALQPGSGAESGYGAALSQLVFAKRRLYDWQGLDELSKQLHQAVADGREGVTPFAFLAEAASAAEQRRCATTFARGIEQSTAAQRQQLGLSPTIARRDAPIRVGFAADGFGEHATGLLVVAMFEALAAHAELEIHLFATAPSDHGPIRRRLETAARMHDVATLTHTQTAHDIRAAGIEVLFDLTGYCGKGSAELFALRAAPVQVNWLAYPGTSGAPWMDYVLADAVVLPAAQRADYSEQVLRLPRCFQPNDPTRVLATPPSREQCGLPTHGMVFACFNNAYKINPAGFAHFMLILQQVPDSVLWLLSGPAGADDRLRAQAVAQGVSAERLVFMPRLPHADYVARFAHVDLFLDTLPYNAHTTASDALWAGCPLLTCIGDTFAGRVAASLLQHVGLSELVTATEEAFVAMACKLGNDRATLVTLREHLLQQREQSPLFDMRGFAADFSRVVQAIGARHRTGQPPIDLDC